MKTFFEMKKPSAAKAALGMLLVAVSTLILLEKPAFADAGAHGGGAMVCRKKNGAIKSAYLLDLWEEEVLKHHSIDRNQKVSLPPDAKIIANPRVTHFLSIVSSNNAQIGKSIAYGVELEQKLEKPLSELEAEIFKKTGKKKKLKIPAPQDVDPELEEKGCKVEGVALWSERYKAVLIDEEIKKAMPQYDQDLIPFHEGSFYAARDNWKAKDSKGSRELLGCLSSQGKNCFQPDDGTPTGPDDAVFSCTSDIADFNIIWSNLSGRYDVTSRIVYTRMENQTFPFGRLVVTARFSELYNQQLGSTKIGDPLTSIVRAVYVKETGPRNLISAVWIDICRETKNCYGEPEDYNRAPPHMLDRAFYKFGFYNYPPHLEDYGDSTFRVGFIGVHGKPLSSEFRCVRKY